MTHGVGARTGENGKEIAARLKASLEAGKILGLTWLKGLIFLTILWILFFF